MCKYENAFLFYLSYINDIYSNLRKKKNNVSELKNEQTNKIHKLILD